MSEPVLLVEKSEGIATLTLNRPGVLNALSEELRDLLAQTIEDLRGDHEIGVVILAGAGRAFCAGLDLKEMSDPNRKRKAIPDPPKLLRSLDQPVIACTSRQSRKKSASAWPASATGVARRPNRPVDGYASPPTDTSKYFSRIQSGCQRSGLRSVPVRSRRRGAGSGTESGAASPIAARQPSSSAWRVRTGSACRAGRGCRPPARDRRRRRRSCSPPARSRPARQGCGRPARRGG